MKNPTVLKMYRLTFFISLQFIVFISMGPVFKRIDQAGLEPLFATIFYGVSFGCMLVYWSRKAKAKKAAALREAERWNNLSGVEKQLEKLEEIKQSGLIPTLGRVTSGFMHGVFCMGILVTVVSLTGLVLKGIP